MSEDWSVAFVAQTVSGEVVLKMTEAQARELVDGLGWLLADEGEDEA